MLSLIFLDLLDLIFQTQIHKYTSGPNFPRIRVCPARTHEGISVRDVAEEN